MRPGETIVLAVERPAVGGRMIGRADGRVVFVRGAIPGERVEARVERVQRQVAWAATTRVLEASADRVSVPPGLGCGGQVLAHVAEPRQRALKAEMLGDALRRIGKIALAHPPDVVGGPSDGYRTRARVHVRDGRAGFFEEGTHEVCDLAASRQMAPASVEVVERLGAALSAAATELEAEIEWAEDVPGTTRLAHVTPGDGRAATAVASLSPVEGLDGLRWSLATDPRDGGQSVWGPERIVDHLRSTAGHPVAVAHGPRAFFQGNRFLLQDLVDDVVARLAGPVLDLFAGVGLFALAAAAAGHRVTAVEGDPVAAQDLVHNAAGHDALAVHAGAVEAHLAGSRGDARTVIVDPPRTGLSPDAVRGLLAWAPERVVYVSCDPATLARDLRRCLDAGYRLGPLRVFDLFPRTGHVETVVTLER